MSRRWICAGLALASALALGGCASDEPGGSGTTPTPSASLTGDLLTIAPLDAVDGAEARTVDGVSVDVPAGWVLDRQEGDDGTTQITVYDPADELNPVGITVSSAEATDGAVTLQADVTWTQLGAAGAEDLQRHPVDWATWADGVGITGLVPRDTGAESSFLSVSTRDEDGTLLLSLSAQSSDGSLEESLQYQVLRTVRPAP